MRWLRGSAVTDCDTDITEDTAMRESMDLVVWILAPMQGDPSQHPPTQTPPSRCRAQGFAYPHLYRDVVVLLLVFWLSHTGALIYCREDVCLNRWKAQIAQKQAQRSALFGGRT